MCTYKHAYIYVLFNHRSTGLCTRLSSTQAFLVVDIFLEGVKAWETRLLLYRHCSSTLQKKLDKEIFSRPCSGAPTWQDRQNWGLPSGSGSYIYGLDISASRLHNATATVGVLTRERPPLTLHTWLVSLATVCCTM